MWLLFAGLLFFVVLLLWFRRQEGFTSIYEIPKIIWTFWNDDNLPEFINKTIEKWRRLNPDWQIRVLTPKNIGEYLGDVDIFKFKFANTPPRQSDFVRLHVLAKYGGVWVDASVVPKSSFQWVLEEQKKRNVEFIGYYREAATKREEYPVIESWFFACTQGSNFVSKWRDELGVMNTLENEADYKEHVKSRGVDIQDIPQPDYLNIYLSAQAVMQLHMTPEEIKKKIYVMKSEDGPFKHSVQNGWNEPKAMKWICDQPKSELPDIIKIYGLERRAIDADESLKCVYKIFEE